MSLVGQKKTSSSCGKDAGKGTFGVEPLRALPKEFRVVVEYEARPLIAQALAKFNVPGAFVSINRLGPVGDVVRGADGKAVWSIEHPHPWEISLGAKEGLPESEFLHVAGFRVILLFQPRPDETGVRVIVHEGALRVEQLATP